MPVLTMVCVVAGGRADGGVVDHSSLDADETWKLKNRYETKQHRLVITYDCPRSNITKCGAQVRVAFSSTLATVSDCDVEHDHSGDTSNRTGLTFNARRAIKRYLNTAVNWKPRAVAKAVLNMDLSEQDKNSINSKVSSCLIHQPK